MPLLDEHKGRKRYTLWFVDMEGNEDFLTMSLTWKQASVLEASMHQRKAAASISDFLLRDDTKPDNYMQVLEYINDKLQEEERRSA